MFFDCSEARALWEHLDVLGKAHWGDAYTTLTQNEIPVLLNQYNPIALFHLSALWAMWAHWCRYFHDDDDSFSWSDQFEWVDTVMIKTRDQLRMRVQEAHSAVQWVEIVQERRLHKKDRNPSASLASKATEKEFLLIHSQHINTNSENININGNTPPAITAWFGHQHLIKLHSQTGCNPKMEFNFHAWEAHTRPPDHPYPASYGAGDWIIMPRHCLDDY
jgi:hypothetical protein